MTTTLELIGLAGPAADLRARPGRDGQLTVGRSPECGGQVEDELLSRLHFRLVGVEDQWVLEDLASRNGTYLDGQRVERAVVADGGRISAGQSLFEVVLNEPIPGGALPDQAEAPVMAPVLLAKEPEVDGGPLGPAPAAPPVAMLTETKPSDAPIGPPPAPWHEAVAAGLRESLAGEGTLRPYALVDGGAQFETVVRARLLGHQVFILLAGEVDPNLAYATPYLIDLSNPDPAQFLVHWAGLLGQSAGLLLACPADLAQVHAQLRRLIVQADQTGQEYLQDFSAPDKFQALLAGAAPAHHALLFDLATQWLCESQGQDGPEFVAWTLRDGRPSSSPVHCPDPAAIG